VRELRDYARYFCAMALGAESHGKLKPAFDDLRELKVDVAYPFLLELNRDYDGGALSAEDFHQAVRLVESFVFRRAICSIPTNSMNKTFATMGRSLRKDRYLESVSAHLLSLRSYRRFPSDEEFKRDLRTRDLYNLRSRSAYWLRRLGTTVARSACVSRTTPSSTSCRRTRSCPPHGEPSLAQSGSASSTPGCIRSAT
jgi:uncharacterized protein with ParB-like and HNH nuclease domain